MTTTFSHAGANPYVGPRTFAYEQRRLFFGREREARDLLARVVSERLLLFYAQSGAGKSSLLHTRLIPQLREEEGFYVLPVGRVSGELPQGVESVDNIYLFNLMSSIDTDEGHPVRLAQLALGDFLAHLVSEDGTHWVYDPAATEFDATADPMMMPRYVLIIDQFEEIITTHPNHWREREDFFRQVNEAMMADPNLWVVLTLREDYVAALDPYAHLMDDKLRARFYMERMGIAAALDAIRRPAELGGRPFAPDVAETLVDNLRRIKLAGQEQEQLGQYVEPVQLQVVCYQLWERLKMHPPGPITEVELQQSGDVDSALGAFFSDAILAVLAANTHLVAQRQLREWFEKELITKANTRGTVYQGDADTAGMPNRVVQLLIDRFLLRRELRSGAPWIEIVHDRFIAPILQSNREWLQQQNILVRAAQAWQDAGRNPSLLLPAQQFAALRQEMAESEADPLVTEFVRASEAEAQATLTKEMAQRREQELKQAQELAKASQARLHAEAQRAAEADARRREQVHAARRFRILSIALGIAGVLAILLATIAAAYGVRSQNNARAVEEARKALEVEFGTSEARRLAVDTAREALALQFGTSEARRWAAETAQADSFAIANAASAALTAVASTPIPSTNIPDPQSTAQPQPLATPTSDPAAQSTQAALQMQLAQVQSTQTAVAVQAAQTATAFEPTQTAVAGTGIILSKPFIGDYPITQHFGANAQFYSQFSYDGVPLKGHNGIDFGLPNGTPVLATDDGVVSLIDFEPGGLGNFVRLDHSWGQSIYAQLDAITAQPGQAVRRGDLIAYSGNSGASTGSYLSFRIRINPYERTDGWGGFSDPLPYLDLAQQQALSPQSQRSVQEAGPQQQAQSLIPTTTDEPEPGAVWTNPLDNAVYIYVPAGPFLMGADESDESDERPQHTVSLSGFWIMETEVTNAQYGLCVAVGVCEAPTSVQWEISEFARYPVTDISWQQAQTYAAWAGGQLPTEAQWEKAARGMQGNRYPWGNDWNGLFANHCDLRCLDLQADPNADDGYAETAPVGAYPSGASPYGVMDMAGNVWEWVADWYDENYYANSPIDDPQGPASGEQKVVRGGSCCTNRSTVQTFRRSPLRPQTISFDTGFRVLRNTTPP